MREILIKVIKILTITSIISALIIFSVVANDCHHLEECEEQHCIICNLIITARTVMSIVLAVCIYVILGHLIFIFLSIMHKTVIFLMHNNSLFSQDIQFNE